MPPIRAELELSPDMIGIIGALPLISFILATLVAPLAADRLGARNTAVLSGGFGAVGLVLISQASGVLSLGVGVVACGICTGLMMPALTAAMQALVKRLLHRKSCSQQPDTGYPIHFEDFGGGVCNVKQGNAHRPFNVGGDLVFTCPALFWGSPGAGSHYFARPLSLIRSGHYWWSRSACARSDTGFSDHASPAIPVASSNMAGH